MVPALEHLQKALAAKSKEFAKIIKIGRTHLQDATPVTLGQEFSGYARPDQERHRAGEELPAASARHSAGRHRGRHRPQCREGLRQGVRVRSFRRWPACKFVAAENKFEGMAAHDAFAEISGAYNVLAASLMKIANDIRLLGSGPRSGLAEINLPENEPGSSIMPGKVNPTQAEAMTMVAAQIMGNNVAVTVACSQRPSGAQRLQAGDHPQRAAIRPADRRCVDELHRHCVVGITAEPAAASSSRWNNRLMLVTALNTHIGYDNAGKVREEGA